MQDVAITTLQHNSTNARGDGSTKSRMHEVATPLQQLARLLTGGFR